MSISYINEIQRKLIHLSSLWMVGAIYFLNDIQSLGLFGLMLAGMTGFEIGRRYWPFFKKTTHLLIGKILRQHESDEKNIHLTGAFYVVLAVFLSLIFFTKEVTMTSLSIMLVADTAAALIGRKLGKNHILGKTIEGSLAFFITSIIILMLAINLGLNISFYIAFVIGLVATTLELISHKIHVDDNISIVLGTGLIITLFQIF